MLRINWYGLKSLLSILAITNDINLSETNRRNKSQKISVSIYLFRAHELTMNQEMVIISIILRMHYATFSYVLFCSPYDFVLI